MPPTKTKQRNKAPDPFGLRSAFFANYGDVIAHVRRFNLAIPPSFQHLLLLYDLQGHPNIQMLRDNLTFHVKMAGDPPGTKGVYLNRIVATMAASFSDFPRQSRHTLNGFFDALTKEHVKLFARFVCIFEMIEGPIENNSIYYKLGWFDVLFRIFAQNQHLALSQQQWSNRIRNVYHCPRIQQMCERHKPRMLIRRPYGIELLVKALSGDATRKKDKVSYDNGSLPSIQSIRDIWTANEENAFPQTLTDVFPNPELNLAKTAG